MPFSRHDRRARIAAREAAQCDPAAEMALEKPKRIRKTKAAEGAASAPAAKDGKGKKKK